MIEQFSLPMRRILAIGILILSALLLASAIIMPLAERVSLSRDALAESRYRLAKLEAISQQAPAEEATAIPAGSLISAKDQIQALAALSGYIGQTAGRFSMGTVSVNPPAAQAIKSSAAAQISVSGDETAIMNFVFALETGKPFIRLRQWKIEAVEGQSGQVTLSALAVAAWEAK